MALYFHFNETTGDLVYSDKATYGVEGYTSLGEQTDVNPTYSDTWIFDSKRASIKTVTKDSSLSDRINVLTSMSCMFQSCTSLTSLDLSGLDTSNVTNMMFMFGGCFALVSPDLSGLDTSNVTNMMFMFSGCTALTSLDLSGLDTSNVTDTGYMFQNCTSLTSLDLSGLDTSNVTAMSYMFDGCTALTSLDLSGLDTSNVTNMYQMFRGCTALTSLDLSGFDTSNETSTYQMFDGCTNLRLITISDKMSNALSELPADQYYPASGGSPVAKADLTAGTWVRDEADLTKVTSLVQQAQMSQAISRRIGSIRRDLEEQIKELRAQISRLEASTTADKA